MLLFNYVPIYNAYTAFISTIVNYIQGCSPVNLAAVNLSRQWLRLFSLENAILTVNSVKLDKMLFFNLFLWLVNILRNLKKKV